MGQGDGVGCSPSSPAFETLLAAARGGNAQAMGVLLQSFRPYLLAVARRGLPENLRAKYDGTDVVQETLLEAHRGFQGFDGSDADDLRVWLGGILKHNLLDLIRRHVQASKRSIARERPLADGLESGEYPGGAIDPCPTPGTLSIAREDVSALREALSRLPADEQAVIVFRHFESLSFQEVGRRMGRSPEAARKLWTRAIARLQHLLESTGDVNP